MSAPEPLPLLVKPWKSIDRGLTGEQHVYRFDNGYGASVIRGPYSYGGESGLFELGVITFDGDQWSLTYETPITSDVLGHLDLVDVAETLDAIAALEAQS